MLHTNTHNDESVETEKWILKFLSVVDNVHLSSVSRPPELGCVCVDPSVNVYLESSGFVPTTLIGQKYWSLLEGVF